MKTGKKVHWEGNISDGKKSVRWFVFTLLHFCMYFNNSLLYLIIRTHNTRTHIQNCNNTIHALINFINFNYPIKNCLVSLQRSGDIDMDCPHQKFCVSWFCIRVSTVGTTMAVQSWNKHTIPGIDSRDLYYCGYA